MRKFVNLAALGVMVMSLAVCTGSSVDQSVQETLQREADYYEIDQIEKTFHEATTTKNIDMMMSLWAPNATLTSGGGETATGLDEIKQVWLQQSESFDPSNHWISDHPAYKLEITVNGDRGTLHFECHYVDYDTHKMAGVTAADLDVARIDGRWLITNFVGGSTDLLP